MWLLKILNLSLYLLRHHLFLWIVLFQYLLQWFCLLRHSYFATTLVYINTLVLNKTLAHLRTIGSDYYSTIIEWFFWWNFAVLSLTILEIEWELRFHYSRWSRPWWCVISLLLQITCHKATFWLVFDSDPFISGGVNWVTYDYRIRTWIQPKPLHHVWVSYISISLYQRQIYFFPFIVKLL